MKRRYKLFLIIILGTIMTIIINSSSITKKISIVALGDGLSIGMTPYNVAGTSFNDYLKEKLEKVNNLDSFNNEFAYEHLTIHKLNENLNNNALGKFTRVPIKQTIAKAELLTVAIGIDELADLSITKNINTEIIDDYLHEMEFFLKTIRDFYEKKIIVLGLYPAYNLNKKDVIEINSKLQTICGKYNVQFLDILALSLNEKYYLEKNSYYMNYEAHREIAGLIYSMYKK